jgi:ABC-type branched-subunit amino acid transport system permease subunit
VGSIAAFALVATVAGIIGWPSLRMKGPPGVMAATAGNFLIFFISRTPARTKRSAGQREGAFSLSAGRPSPARSFYRALPIATTFDSARGSQYFAQASIKARRFSSASPRR